MTQRRPRRAPYWTNIVQPLELAWRGTLDSIAKARGWPTSDAPQALGAAVQALSQAYNLEGSHKSLGTNMLAARLSFSFPRDVPKSAAAVRELVASRAVDIPADRPLAVLDVGAGLGATFWGVLRALAAFGARGTVHVDAIDEDQQALAVAREIIGAHGPRVGELGCTLRTEARDGRGYVGNGPYDLVLLGQVLSELDLSLPADARVRAHAERIVALSETLRPNGAIVVIEPALKDRTRHLHEVRQAVLDTSRLHVFAPCLGGGVCPMLASPNDWCHEDLDVALPDWLVPTARAAGLRWEGLTFSYVVFRKHPRAAQGAGQIARIVSKPRVTKGKRELFLCTPTAAGLDIVRAMRLDRDASELNQDCDALGRGELVEVEPTLDAERPRITSQTRVSRIDVREAGG